MITQGVSFGECELISCFYLILYIAQNKCVSECNLSRRAHQRRSRRARDIPARDAQAHSAESRSLSTWALWAYMALAAQRACQICGSDVVVQEREPWRGMATVFGVVAYNIVSHPTVFKRPPRPARRSRHAPLYTRPPFPTGSRLHHHLGQRQRVLQPFGRAGGCDGRLLLRCPLWSEDFVKLADLRDVGKVYAARTQSSQNKVAVACCCAPAATTGRREGRHRGAPL